MVWNVLLIGIFVNFVFVGKIRMFNEMFRFEYVVDWKFLIEVLVGDFFYCFF